MLPFRGYTSSSSLAQGRLDVGRSAVHFLCTMHDRLFSQPPLPLLEQSHADCGTERQDRILAFEQLFGASTLLAEATCTLTGSGIDSVASGAVNMAIVSALDGLQRAQSAGAAAEDNSSDVVPFRTQGDTTVTAELLLLPPPRRHRPLAAQRKGRDAQTGG